jgi:hypothetical protein
MPGFDGTRVHDEYQKDTGILKTPLELFFG